LRPKVFVAVQVCWITAWLVGGGVDLAEGHNRAGLIGLMGGAIFAVLTLVAMLRRKRLSHGSWRAS
jgi:uncharacterized membrane protein (DUF441 family)